MTFAISRHAVVDLAQVLHCAPLDSDGERLPPAELQKLRALLVVAELPPCCEERQELREEDQRLGELRRMYEPVRRRVCESLAHARRRLSAQSEAR